MLGSNDNPEKGKCVGCGFLARRAIKPRLSGGEHFEFLTQDRANGGGNSPNTPESDWYVPDCGMSEESFFNEIGFRASVVPHIYTENSQFSLQVLQAINRDRKCEGWYQWYPGNTPKEHMDRMLLERAEQDRREHREQMAILIKQSQDAHRSVTEGIVKIVADMAQAAKDNKLASDKISMLVVRLTWAQVVLGSLSVLIALIALWIAMRESSVDSLIRLLSR